MLKATNIDVIGIYRLVLVGGQEIDVREAVETAPTPVLADWYEWVQELALRRGMASDGE